ncbi:FIST N-terminal domain-containing protein [Haliangium ochraceum]|uniref:PDZ domain-containing protein n=1 Tax=Haliangium ochraceum (strain DSM 14365 / JCM 11303 / SMP-2) TaxID=502025 RepID=D0LVT8_HALO1|nr:FIST N-terminal domain-containing protein [Haliangium ochraceum]ACY14072.1 domain of unknown function DUF1745 [Haliangium ochraceum DSM 14365]
MRVERLNYAGGSWSKPLPPLDSPQTLVMVYGAPSFGRNRQPLEELVRAFPSSKVIGCSTSGELGGLDIGDESLSVAVTRFAHTDIRAAAARVSSTADSYEAGRQIAQKLAASPGLRSIFVLSEGLNVNGSELVRGFNENLSDSVLVTGGLAGDGDRFEKTWVMWGNKVDGNMVVAIGFYGDHIAVSHGTQGGWDPFGPERKVTRSRSNVLYELDGKPALSLYKSYLGDEASGLPGSGLRFPLSLRDPRQPEKFLVRTLLAVDEAEQSMTFAGDIPEGFTAQLMKADFDRLVAGAETAAKMTAETGPPIDSKHLAVAISCVGRRLILGSRTEDEIEVVTEVLPAATELVGFYSYGEISPFAQGACDLHNQTMTLTLISESPTPIRRDLRNRWSSPGMPVATPPRSPSSPSLTPPTTMTRPGSARSSTAPPAPTRSSTAPPRAMSSRPSRRSSVLSVPMPTVEAPPSGSNELTIRSAEVDGIRVLRLAGTIGERFPRAELTPQLSGALAIELGGVTRVTSFGVRAWMDTLSAAGGKLRSLHLVNCPEPVVTQLSMIRGFAANGRVLSFAAPYYCDACGTAFSVYLDVDNDQQAIRSGMVDARPCPQCQSAASFEDNPGHFFAFAQDHLGPLSEAERALLRLGASSASDVAAGRVEKDIADGTTTIAVHGILPEGFAWSRALEGVDGHLLIDLREAAPPPPAQERGLAGALFEALPQVEQAQLRGCPEGVIEVLLTRGFPAGLTVESIALSGRCSGCKSGAVQVVSATELAGNSAPYRVCRRCGETLEFDAAKRVSRGLGQLVNPGPQVKSWQWALIGGASLLVVAMVALLAYRGLRPDADTAAVAAPNAADLSGVQGGAEEPTLAAASAGAATVIAPGWTERPIRIDDQQVLVVGMSEIHSSADAALEQARQRATRILIERVAKELSRAASVQMLAQQAAPLRADADAVIEDVFQRQLGDIAGLERSEVFTDTGERGVLVHAQYRLGAEQYQRVVAYYRHAARWRGAEFAPLFPLVAAHQAPTEATVQVTDVRRGSLASRRGLRIGDMIVSVETTPAFRVDDVAQALERAWSTPRPKGRFTVQVQSGAVARELSFPRTSPRRR